MLDIFIIHKFLINEYNLYYKTSTPIMVGPRGFSLIRYHSLKAPNIFVTGNLQSLFTSLLSCFCSHNWELGHFMRFHSFYPKLQQQIVLLLLEKKIYLYLNSIMPHKLRPVLISIITVLFYNLFLILYSLTLLLYNRNGH